MKKIPSNFEEKIPQQQLPLNEIYDSQGNNNIISELRNILMNNAININSVGQNVHLVSSFIFIIIY